MINFFTEKKVQIKLLVMIRKSGRSKFSFPWKQTDVSIRNSNIKVLEKNRVAPE